MDAVVRARERRLDDRHEAARALDEERRAGRITIARLELAAFCGHEPARLVLGCTCDPSDDEAVCWEHPKVEVGSRGWSQDVAYQQRWPFNGLGGEAILLGVIELARWRSADLPEGQVRDRTLHAVALAEEILQKRRQLGDRDDPDLRGALDRRCNEAAHHYGTTQVITSCMIAAYHVGLSSGRCGAPGNRSSAGNAFRYGYETVQDTERVRFAGTMEALGYMLITPASAIVIQPVVDRLLKLALEGA